MKLYYKPGACSLASHIALHEIGAEFDIDQVDTQPQKTQTGGDFGDINPKGVVPVLKLDNGEILTEGAAILQYIAEQNPSAGLAATAGTMERTRVQEHLTYISSELHKSFGPLFASSSTDEQKETARENVGKKLDYVNSLLADGRQYLVDNKFTVADAYLFVVANWANFTSIDLNKWSHVADFVKRVSARENVQRAMKAEGLLG
jgi:glutathione S-transferase